jgi:hypothetical protein
VCQSGYFSERSKKLTLKFGRLPKQPIFAQLKKLIKTSTMKKVFAILAVAGFMAACNSGENKAASADTAKTAVDTAKAAMDTTHAAMDTTKAAADTTKK